MSMKYLQLNDIGAYKIAFHLSNYVWNIVSHWNEFARRTIGDEFVKAIDSVSANIAEGFGRFTKKDKIHFYRYSFGSVMESLDWNEKSKCRNLLNEEQYNYIFTELKKLPWELHFFIKYTNEKLKK
ncbi:four helix bundle protein [Candidatus Peregrinibacteria bacterium]|nr:four helix bundle protein [Candidatus Peregrinibacteria bacterium]